VSALKLLIIWRRDEHRQRRVQLAADFIAAARERGVLSVLEPVVRATLDELDDGDWDADAAIREAARELSQLGQDLYKVQVPLAGEGEPAEQRRASETLGDDITGPWVVLSQGVDRERFQPAVEAACRGGASGFLAGRALWSDVVGAHDTLAALRARSVPRLERLIETVDREARPWSQS
jgi:sulfofructosephosphate aldolase